MLNEFDYIICSPLLKLIPISLIFLFVFMFPEIFDIFIKKKE